MKLSIAQKKIKTIQLLSKMAKNYNSEKTVYPWLDYQKKSVKFVLEL